MSHHTLLHRLVRPPVRLIAKTAVTPNQLTTLRLATGLAAAAAFAMGREPWPALGALSMGLSLLLDRADGELARATGRMSQGGYRYDLLADGASTVAVFIGMGWGSRATLGPLAPVCGLVAAVSVVILFLLMQVVEPARKTPVVRPFDPDDALVAAPLLVWAGLMPWTVLTAAVVSPLVAAVLAVLALLRPRAVEPGRR
jgi:archaetidylinositol phosphate synthase